MTPNVLPRAEDAEGNKSRKKKKSSRKRRNPAFPHQSLKLDTASILAPPYTFHTPTVFSNGGGGSSCPSASSNANIGGLSNDVVSEVDALSCDPGRGEMARESIELSCERMGERGLPKEDPANEGGRRLSWS